MRWWNSYFFNLTPSWSQKSPICQGTGASFSQTSLANQPKVNKHRLKLQKTKIRAYLYSPICISALLQIFGSNVGGPTWTWQEKTKLWIKTAPRRSHDQSVELLHGRKRRLTRLCGWVMEANRVSFWLFLTQLLSGEPSSPCWCLLCYPQIVERRREVEAQPPPPTIHHHNHQTQHSHAALPVTGFKIKVIVEMNLLSIRNCLTSFLI